MCTPAPGLIAKRLCGAKGLCKGALLSLDSIAAERGDRTWAIFRDLTFEIDFFFSAFKPGLLSLLLMLTVLS